MNPTRSCGPCSACCTTSPVESDPLLDAVTVFKPAHTRCPHQGVGDSPARGCCSVYERRPKCCKVYRCEWLDGAGGDDERPDLSGVIIETARDEMGRVRMAILVPAPGFDERSPGFVRAARSWRARGVIVLTPSCEYMNEEQLAWLRTVEIRFSDGNVLRVPDAVGRDGPPPN